MSAVVGTSPPVPTAPRARLDNLHLTLAGLVLCCCGTWPGWT
jgi:hypothetical protein